ncbi:MAG: hypothetical protein FWD64_11050, partial [Acidobacteriaceae bacterium]|nr:hypothetical protein [Acidobacteriaceae bacterium]
TVISTVLYVLLALAWLKIPDSHWWQLVFSVLYAVLLAAGILSVKVILLRWLRRSETHVSMLHSIGLLILWAFVILIVADAFLHIENNAPLRAGYWNSRLGPQMRVLFSVVRLYQWQIYLQNVLVWIVLPMVALPLSIETVVRGLRGWRNGARVVFKWQNWLTILIASGMVYWITESLLQWQPGHTVKGEIVSVILRLGLLVAVDLFLAVYAVAVVSELLSRSDAARRSAA